VRRGRGFRYVDANGHPVRDPDEVLRLEELVIPPAWQDVWICADPRGHLQATGIDAAGRKQYLYHPQWREQRDRQKFDHMLGFAQQLPKLRRHVLRSLRSSEELDRERVLACAVRLLDVGLFRLGTEQLPMRTAASAWRPSPRRTSSSAATRSCSTTSARAGSISSRRCATTTRGQSSAL
jgi:DNA topoisomerase-1